MNAKQRSFLVNLNRGLIFILAVAGLLMDGYQGSDLPSSLALVFWLWLPVCARIEANILNWVSPTIGKITASVPVCHRK